MYTYTTVTVAHLLYNVVMDINSLLLYWKPYVYREWNVELNYDICRNDPIL